MTPLSRRGLVAVIVVAGLTGLPAAHAQEASGAVTLFENVRVFDGRSATLSADFMRGSRYLRRREPARRHRCATGTSRVHRTPEHFSGRARGPDRVRQTGPVAANGHSP